MPNDEGSDPGLQRTCLLYDLLIAELVVGRNTIADELSKPKESQDAYYLMGQAALNVSLHNAATALEDAGLIDDDMVRCRDCGELFTDHDEHGHDGDEDFAPGEAPVAGGSAPTKPPSSKLN
jgi:hypothetical protein